MNGSAPPRSIWTERLLPQPPVPVPLLGSQGHSQWSCQGSHCPEILAPAATGPALLHPPQTRAPPVPRPDLGLGAPLKGSPGSLLSLRAALLPSIAKLEGRQGLWQLRDPGPPSPASTSQEMGRGEGDHHVWAS